MKEVECELVRKVIENANREVEKAFYIAQWMSIQQGNDCY